MANKPTIDFKNVTTVGNIDWHAFSSAKCGKLPQNRKENRETAKTNAYTAHIRLVKAQYRQYLDEGDNLSSLTTLLSTSKTRTVPLRLPRKFMARLL
ncbi:uncharacterized protein TrAtP1_003869 [Trichoderma atroviride]|uniref:uncharacterized protein n=1 Tax=Hypocrea atroviridis TaxID=63577 RepID=UPI00332719A0|nr:hypothetical protein TrAtP1_003869 [Trichoderma atroviride]